MKSQFRYAIICAPVLAVILLGQADAQSDVRAGIRAGILKGKVKEPNGKALEGDGARNPREER